MSAEQQTWQETRHGSRRVAGERLSLAAPAVRHGPFHPRHFQSSTAGGRSRRGGCADITRRQTRAGEGRCNPDIARAIRNIPPKLSHTLACCPGLERSRLHSGGCGGRRVASHTSRLAEILAALLPSGGLVEPIQVHSCGFQPSSEPTHHQRLSSLINLAQSHGEATNGTVLYRRGEFPQMRGAHQHEFG